MHRGGWPGDIHGTPGIGRKVQNLFLDSLSPPLWIGERRHEAQASREMLVMTETLILAGNYGAPWKVHPVGFS